jgi:hypothetical protein
MPIRVKDPAGGEHIFADGTPTDAINSEMQRMWAQRSAPPPDPAATIPPGLRPGVPTATNEGDVDASMVPLSPEAQRAQRMLMMGAVTGNRAGVMGAQDILKADPTYQMRAKQATTMGENAARRAEGRVAGAKILRSYAQLRHSFDTAPDDVLTGAIGPYNTEPYSGWMPLVHGMTVPQAKSAYFGKNDSWNLQNLFGHDVHGITNAFIANAGKGINVSDERQKMFDATMRDFMRATDRKSAQEILDHAKAIISNDFYLTPEEADQVIKQEVAALQKNKTNAAAQHIQDAREAISKGAPREGVIQRLKSMGIDPGAL